MNFETIFDGMNSAPWVLWVLLGLSAMALAVLFEEQVTVRRGAAPARIFQAERPVAQLGRRAGDRKAVCHHERSVDESAFIYASLAARSASSQISPTRPSRWG